MKLEFSQQIVKNTQILWKYAHWEPSSCTRTDEQMDRHDETNSRFLQFYAKHLKNRDKRDSLLKKIPFSEYSKFGDICRHRKKELHRK